MGQAQINVRTRACSRTSIARTRQAALTHNVRGKELKTSLNICLHRYVNNSIYIFKAKLTKSRLLCSLNNKMQVDMITMHFYHGPMNVTDPSDYQENVTIKMISTELS